MTTKKTPIDRAAADNQTGHSTIGLLHIGGDLLTEAMYGDDE